MEKGQIITIQIEDVTAQGMGVGRSEDGMAVFVRGALPGDVVQAELTKVKKNYAQARLCAMEEESPDRIEGLCDYDDRCGGCPYSRLDYPRQLEVKEQHVRDALVRLGGIEDPEIRPILGMEEPWRYRNKAVMQVSTGGIITRKGGIVENLGEPAVGFYQPKSHQVVDCLDCALQSEPAVACAQALRQFMEEDNITGFDPKWHKGLLRHMIVRTAFGTGEVMVILVINGKGIPNGAKLVAMLDEAVASITYEDDPEPYSLESVMININRAEPIGSGKKGKKPAVNEKGGFGIYGPKTEILAGRGTITEVIGDMEFEISPLSFYQVNPWQMAVLYDQAAEYAGLSGGETILDLYCGAGTIGLWLLDELRSRDPEGFAKTRVLGIESVKSAVLSANRNAVLNQVVNARYVCGEAEKVLPELMGEEPLKDETLRVNKVDLAVLDPPRAGCDSRLLDAVCEAEPSRIVYVSCDPATLARDVKYLNEKGYRFEEATPVDLFPWTGHVETVVCLSNKNAKPKDYVEIGVDAEDYYRIKDSGKK